MQQTNRAPNVPLEHFKRTKIIATIGPSTNSYEAILSLIKAGANGIRMNFSHGTHKERTQQIKWIRKASHAAARTIKEGGANPLRALLAKDAVLGELASRMDELLNGRLYVGRAPEQVLEFVREEVDPLLKRHADALGAHGDVRL